jgi:hypothetical protein
MLLCSPPSLSLFKISKALPYFTMTSRWPKGLTSYATKLLLGTLASEFYSSPPALKLHACMLAFWVWEENAQYILPFVFINAAVEVQNQTKT